MIRLLIVFLMLITMSSSEAFCSQGPAQKLKRGLVNIVSAPVEIPRQVRVFWIDGSQKTFHISAWLFCGLVKGLVMTPARTASGIWDVVTFPLGLPRGYESIRKPGYVFDDWPQRKTGVVYKNIGDP